MKKMLLLATALLMFSGIAWAQENGTISGTIMAEVDGIMIPLPFAHLDAFPVNGFHPVSSDITDSTGAYILEVPFGAYHVKANAMNFISKWYDNVHERSEATEVQVTAENNPGNINFVLAGQQRQDGFIEGRIYNADTDEGIMMAVVHATRVNGEPLELTTNSMWGGHYTFPHLPAGAYVIDAQKLGWSHEYYPDTLVVDNNEFHEIDIALTRNAPPELHGAISGVVTDDGTDLPIVGARVTASSGWFFHRTVMTDSTGHYLIADLPADSYDVSASKDGYYRLEYPDEVSVDSMEVIGIDFALVHIVETGISGTVTDAGTGLPIEDARVFAINISNHWLRICGHTDEDGNYFIRTQPGEYEVEVVKEGYWRQEYPDTVVVTNDGVTEDIDFALEAISYSSIAGNVTDSLGNPIPRAHVEARLMHGRFVTHTRTDSTGAYLLDHVIPGTYRVMAFKHGFIPGAYPDSIVVAEDQDITGINIILRNILPPGDGIISGYVFDESTDVAIDHALVMAIGFQDNHGYRRHHFRYQFTDSTGAYAFNDLPEVPFRIFAVARGYMGEFYDNVQHYADATPVTPDAANINFELSHRIEGPRTVAGRINVPEGMTAEGVILYAMVNGEIAAIEVSDPFGAYSFDDMESGTYDIVASSINGDGQLNSVDIVFNDNRSADIDIVQTSVNDGDATLPEITSLSQNYPNPFNAGTVISFSIPASSNVELSVYNMVGQKITTLVNGSYTAGSYSITWNGVDQSNQPVSSGIYYYRLTVNGDSQTMKMTLLK